MSPRLSTRIIAIVSATTFGLAITGLAALPSQADEPAVEVGDCLVVEDAWSSTSPYKVVDCQALHNSEVYDIVPYPTRAGAPSTLSEEELSRIGDECSFIAFDSWLGKDIALPTRIWSWFISAPSDEAWEAGNREVLCRTMRPTAKYEALRYTGTIPDLIASTPILEWLNCMTSRPKSGANNASLACSAKTTYLLLGGVPVKGKVTAKYPKDLQLAADKACASMIKKYAKKGSTGIAALLSKQSVGGGQVFTECFIQVKDWNGKVK